MKKELKKFELTMDDLEYVSGGVDERKVFEQMKDQFRKEDEALQKETAINFTNSNSGLKI